jgi:hypothetical protein
MNFNDHETAFRVSSIVMFFPLVQIAIKTNDDAQLQCRTENSSSHSLHGVRGEDGMTLSICVYLLKGGYKMKQQAN